MTNEQLKQEAIKKAWGDIYELIKDHLIDGCALSPRKSEELGLDSKFLYKSFKLVSNGAGAFYPKEVEEIDNNNGWTRIEPDGTNLPKEGKYKWITKNGTVYVGTFNPKFKEHAKRIIRGCSHYKPYQEEIMPIY